MRRVYLDQAEWIAFSKAALGRPSDSRVADTLVIARFGVEHGLVRFPLSSTTYIETMNVRRWRQREPLARVMGELSRYETIANQRTLLDMELDLALQKRFGRPRTVRTVPVVGFGIAHAFGQARLEQVQSPELLARLRSDPLLADWVRLHREEAMLAGPPEDFPVAWMRYDAGRAAAERFAAGQRSRAEELRKAGFGKGRLPRALVASELVGILDPLLGALARADLPREALFTDAETLTDFFMDLPTRRVAYEMLRARHRDPGQAWKPTDLGDFGALTVAVPYCDIVVTERHWRGVLRAAHVDELFSTVILDDVAELPGLLVAA